MRSSILGTTLFLWVSSVAAELGMVHEFELDNGLQIVVKEDNRSPVVVCQVWYRVGSSYEHNGITGISHVLEHMMFKGTHEYPSGEFARIIAVHGGIQNAFTGRDYTVYYQELANDRLEISFELESNRMAKQLFVPFQFDREMNVVREERRMRSTDQPRVLAYERFRAAAFLRSPYRQPTIGWMEDLEQLTLDEVEAWYKRWYMPNNAILVVVGKVNPETVYQLAQKYFGELPSGNVIAPKRRTEPPQLGSRRIVLALPAKVPVLFLGYRVPVLHTSANPTEAYALEVLSGLLDRGKSARLARNVLRGASVAGETSVRYNLYAHHSDLLIIEASPSAEHTLHDLEQAIIGETTKLREALVNQEELQRAKTQLIAERLFAQDSLLTQARQIGQVEAVGLGWRVLDEYVEAIRNVTPEQLREVARKYLIPRNLTTTWLQTEEQEKAGNTPVQLRGMSDHVEE